MATIGSQTFANTRLYSTSPITPTSIECPDTWYSSPANGIDCTPDFELKGNPPPDLSAPDLNAPCNYWLVSAYSKQGNTRGNNGSSVLFGHAGGLPGGPGKYMIYSVCMSGNANGWTQNWYPDTDAIKNFPKATRMVTIKDPCAGGDSSDPSGEAGCASCSGKHSSIFEGLPGINIYKCKGECIAVLAVPCKCTVIDRWTPDNSSPCSSVDHTKSVLGGYTYTRSGTSQGPWTYRLSDTLGNIAQYGSVEFSDTVIAAAAPVLSFSDCNGNVTNYTADPSDPNTTHAVKHASNGTILKSWSFTRETGSDRITSQADPDGKTTTTVFFPATGTWTDHKPQSTTVRGPSGDVLSSTSYTYDNWGRLSSENINGKMTTYSYTTDQDGNILAKISREVTASPNITTIEEYGLDYDRTTRKHTSDPSMDQVTTTYYFLKNNVKTTYTYKTIDTLGSITTYARYLDSGTTASQATQGTQANLDGDYINLDSGFTAAQKTNLFGKAYKITSNNRSTTYIYDPNTGNLLSVTHPDGSTETYTYYDETPFVKTAKDVRDNYKYFARGNSANMFQVTAIKSANQLPADWSIIPNVVEYDYYPSDAPHGQGGRVWKERKPNIDGNHADERTYEYYEMVNGVEKLRNSATRIYYPYWNGSDYAQQCMTATYDDNDNAKTVTDANGRTISYSYDLLGRLTEIRYSPTIAKRHIYGCCNLLYDQNENGVFTHYSCDESKRVTDIWISAVADQAQTEPPLLHYTYDCFGNIASVQSRTSSQSSESISYSYDNANRIVRADYPSPRGYEQFGYDSAGNQQWKKDGNGSVTLFRYDMLNRITDVYYNYTGSLTSIAYPIRNADISYTYDKGSYLKTSIVERDSTGTSVLRTSIYSYDTEGRVVSYTPSVPCGHGAITYTYNTAGQKTSVNADNYAVYYSYYANGWLKDVSLGSLIVASFTYDPAGNRTKEDYGNQTWTSYAFGNDARYQLSDICYGYRCTDLSGVTNNGGLHISRDNRGRPTCWGSIDGSHSRAYTYDLYGRLATEAYAGQQQITNTYDWMGNELSIQGAQYRGADQLIGCSGHSYVYDYNGNLTRDNATTYTYTACNLVSTIGSNTMIWDASGNRVSFALADGRTWKYVYDVTSEIPAVIQEFQDNSCVRYVREPSGRLLARISAIDSKYYAFDDLGSTMFLTGSSGTITDRYAYDAWGNRSFHIGSTDQPYQYVGSRGYYTHWQTSDLDGTIQLGARLYNSKIRRFEQPDPIRIDRYSQYSYVDDSPLSGTDPTGKLLDDVDLEIPPVLAMVLSGSESFCLLDAFHEAKKIEMNMHLGVVRPDLLAHCYMGCRLAQCVKCPEIRLIGLISMDLAHKPWVPDFAEHLIFNHAGFHLGELVPFEFACLPGCRLIYAGLGLYD